MMRWTGLAPWEFEFTLKGSLLANMAHMRQPTPDDGLGTPDTA